MGLIEAVYRANKRSCNEDICYWVCLYRADKFYMFLMGLDATGESLYSLLQLTLSILHRAWCWECVSIEGRRVNGDACQHRRKGGK